MLRYSKLIFTNTNKASILSNCRFTTLLKRKHTTSRKMGNSVPTYSSKCRIVVVGPRNGDDALSKKKFFLVLKKNLCFLINAFWLFSRIATPTRGMNLNELRY